MQTNVPPPDNPQQQSREERCGALEFAGEGCLDGCLHFGCLPDLLESLGRGCLSIVGLVAVVAFLFVR